MADPVTKTTWSPTPKSLLLVQVSLGSSQMLPSGHNGPFVTLACSLPQAQGPLALYVHSFLPILSKPFCHSGCPCHHSPDVLLPCPSHPSAGLQQAWLWPWSFPLSGSINCHQQTLFHETFPSLSRNVMPGTWLAGLEGEVSTLPGSAFWEACEPLANVHTKQF